MKGTLKLTWRYLGYHRLRTVILIVCLALTFLLPVYLHLLIRGYEANLTERARLTPLVLGPKGNEFELVLRSLYFTHVDGTAAQISLADQQALEAQDRATVIPLHLGYTARQFPVVGTSLEYFSHRQLQPSEGTLPLTLGDAIIGARVASELGLSTGDRLLTDQTSLYNIAAEQPLRMRVVGVLPTQGNPDDQAVFVDVKTAWVIAGIGHGHDDLSLPENQGQLLRKEQDGTYVGSAAVAPYREITPENLESFHFHGDPTAMPLSSLIVLPHSSKDQTILKGQYGVSKSLQLLPPEEVVQELLAIVFRVKRFFDACFSLVLVMTTLFLILVMILTWKLRQRERETLVRIGCARRTVIWLQLSELGLLLAAGFFLALILASVLKLLSSPFQQFV